MEAKEMFEMLDYKETKNDKTCIEYKNDSHGDGDYEYVKFNHMWKRYEHGYYDGYEEKRKKPTTCEVELHKAITQQMKELGWL